MALRATNGISVNPTCPMPGTLWSGRLVVCPHRERKHWVHSWGILHFDGSPSLGRGSQPCHQGAPNLMIQVAMLKSPALRDEDAVQLEALTARREIRKTN